MNKEKFDYRSVPEIKKELDCNRERRKNITTKIDKDSAKFIDSLLEGKRLLSLKVYVTDTELAALTIAEQFNGKFGIPGMSLLSFKFFDIEGKNEAIHNKIKGIEESIVELENLKSKLSQKVTAVKPEYYSQEDVGILL